MMQWQVKIPEAPLSAKQKNIGKMVSMKAIKGHIAKRIFLNKFTLSSAQRLHAFLDRNLAGPRQVKQANAHTLNTLRAKLHNAKESEQSLQLRMETLKSRTLRAEQSLRNQQSASLKTKERFQELHSRTLRAEQSLRDKRSALLKTKERFQELHSRTLRAEQSLRDKRSASLKTKERFQELRSRLLRSQQSMRDIRAKVAAMKARNETGVSAYIIKSMLADPSLEKAFLEMLRQGPWGGHDRLIIRSVAFQLWGQPETRSLGALLLGAFMYDEQLYETSFNYFKDANPKSVIKYLAREYFGSWIFVDAHAGRQALLEYATARSHSVLSEQANDLMEVLIKHHFYDDARHLMETLPALITPPADTDENTLRQIEWVRERLLAKKRTPQSLADDQINLAIMDYKLLDRSRTSSNRGDYVQTLASLANICRFQNVTFAGEDALSQQLEALKGDIHPSRQLEGPAATVVPVALDRDFASGRTYLPNTWLICNGWFMHRNFRGVIDFPFPKNVNPIFISFHINDPDVLTPEVVDELRNYEPIGCRDWTTVYRLKDFGISCFFSGCLTTTIGQILPKAENLPDQHLAAVETPVDTTDYNGWKISDISQVGGYVRDLSLTDGIADAKEMLESYLAYSKIQTSRLHCYLPCRSMGFDVDFRPKNRSDVRFEGLLDLNADEFDTIRAGIETKLEAMYKEIFAGKSKKDVMVLWRDICAPDVAIAKAYYDAKLPAAPTVDVESVLKTINRQLSGVLHENAVEVAFALDENLTNYLPAVIHSMTTHTSGPINVHLIYRGLDAEYLSTLTRAFPEVTFQLFDFSKVDYGSDLRLLSHTTLSTLDRLYLPEVLKDISKVIYLDVDLLVRADLREIFNLDLNGKILAGKLSQLPSSQNVIRLLTQASLKLSPKDAWVMRRRLHKELEMPSKTFNAGVIVMNLELMRDESFTSKYLYLVTECYCNDQDALNLYAARRIQELSPSWNYVVSQDYDCDPKLVHWAGTVKPWSKSLPSLWTSEFATAMKAGWSKMAEFDGK